MASYLLVDGMQQPIQYGVQTAPDRILTDESFEGEKPLDLLDALFTAQTYKGVAVFRTPVTAWEPARH